MLKGYARVSTDGQEVAMQVAALRKAGVVKVVTETRSGALDLPCLQRVLAGLGPGDVLVVWKVDRLARSLRGLLDVADRIRLQGASLRSLTEPIDTGSPVGRAFFQLLGVFSELERSLIRERCAAGRLAALQRGVVFGPPSSVSPDMARQAVERFDYLFEAARALGVTRYALATAVKRQGLSFRSNGRGLFKTREK